jgi:hypothetical protein
MSSRILPLLSLCAAIGCTHETALPTERQDSGAPGSPSLAQLAKPVTSGLPPFEFLPPPNTYTIRPAFNFYLDPANDPLLVLRCEVPYTMTLTSRPTRKPGVLEINGNYTSGDPFGNAGFCSCNSSGTETVYNRPPTSGTVSGTLRGTQLDVSMGGELAAHIWLMSVEHVVSPGSTPPLNVFAVWGGEGAADLSVDGVGACGALSVTVGADMFARLR